MKGKFNASPIFVPTFEALIAQANPSIHPALTLSEVIVGVPTSHVGEKNTRITLTFPENSRFTGSVDFFYDRLDLSEIVTISKQLPILPKLIPAGQELTAVEVVAAFELAYGIAFEPGALNVSPLTVSNKARFSHELVIDASSSSKIWKGSLTIKVEKTLRVHIAGIFNDRIASFSSGHNPITYTESDGPYPLYTVSGVSSLTAINTAIKAINDVSSVTDFGHQDLLEFNADANVETGILVSRHPNDKAFCSISTLEYEGYGEDTNFSIQCKDEHELRGSLLQVGWQTLPIGYLVAKVTTQLERTFILFFESGIIIDTHDVIQRLNDIYGFGLIPDEVVLKAAVPVQGQPNVYILNIQMNNSLNYHGSFDVTVDLTGDPYRYITKNELSDFDQSSFLGS